MIDINDPTIIHCYADIDCASEGVRIPMGKNDVWIAATAKATGFTLMTCDKDFDHLNPQHLSLHFIDPNIPPSP